MNWTSKGDRGVDHVRNHAEGHDLNLMVLKWSPLRDPEDLKSVPSNIPLTAFGEYLAALDNPGSKNHQDVNLGLDLAKRDPLPEGQ